MATCKALAPNDHHVSTSLRILCKEGLVTHGGMYAGHTVA